MHHIKCSDCPKSYICQTGRHLVDGLKSINPPPVGINPPSPNTNSTLAIATPSIDWDNIIILNREDRDYNTRQVREAIQIRRHAPQLNRDQGLEIPSLFSLLVRPKVNPGQQWGVLTSLHSQHHWSSPDEDLCITSEYWGKSQFKFVLNDCFNFSCSIMTKYYNRDNQEGEKKRNTVITDKSGGIVIITLDIIFL